VTTAAKEGGEVPLEILFGQEAAQRFARRKPRIRSDAADKRRWQAFQRGNEVSGRVSVKPVGWYETRGLASSAQRFGFRLIMMRSNGIFACEPSLPCHSARRFTRGIANQIGPQPPDVDGELQSARSRSEDDRTIDHDADWAEQNDELPDLGTYLAPNPSCGPMEP